MSNVLVNNMRTSLPVLSKMTLKCKAQKGLSSGFSHFLWKKIQLTFNFENPIAPPLTVPVRAGLSPQFPETRAAKERCQRQCGGRTGGGGRRGGANRSSARYHVTSQNRLLSVVAVAGLVNFYTLSFTAHFHFGDYKNLVLGFLTFVFMVFIVIS